MIDGIGIEAPQSLVSVEDAWSVSISVSTEHTAALPNGDWVVQVSFG